MNPRREQFPTASRMGARESSALAVISTRSSRGVPRPAVSSFENLIHECDSVRLPFRIRTQTWGGSQYGSSCTPAWPRSSGCTFMPRIVEVMLHHVG